MKNNIILFLITIFCINYTACEVSDLKAKQADPMTFVYVVDQIYPNEKIVIAISRLYLGKEVMHWFSEATLMEDSAPVQIGDTVHYIPTLGDGALQIIKSSR